MARLLLPLGSDVGAMDVQVNGRDGEGRAARTRWTLRAAGNHGPYVPTLAALALLRRMQGGDAPAPGARACAGLLTLAEFDDDFAALDIATQIRREA